MTAGADRSTYLFGIHPVLEHLRDPSTETLEILIARESNNKSRRSVENEARRRGIKVAFVDAGVLTRLVSGARHQGVLAKVPASSYADFTELLRADASNGESRWILALDGVTDPQNFGAIIRTAEGMGVRDLLVPKDRSVGLTASVAKASAGAASHVRVYRVTNLRRALMDLKERGYWIAGLDAGAGEPIGGREYPERLVVVLGNEGTGIRPAVRGECDFLVAIPMRGRVASLNVAVSGGIFLYELVRQGEKKIKDSC